MVVSKEDYIDQFLKSSFFKRAFIVFVAVVQGISCAGLYLGWPSYEKVLREQSVYAELCDDYRNSTGDIINPDPECSERDLRFNIIYTVGSSAFAGYILFGFPLDKYGPKRTAIVAVFLVIVGVTLFAFSKSTGPDMFVPGMFLMCLGGNGLSLSTFHLQGLFPKHAALISALMSAAYGVCSMVFVSFQWIYDATGVSHRTLFLWFLAWMVLIFLSVLLFTPKHSLMKTAGGPKVPLKTILTSRVFVCLVVFMAISVHVVFSFFGTVSLHMKSMTDDDEADRYVRIFQYISSFSWVAYPPAGRIIDRFGFPPAFGLSSFFISIFAVCSVIKEVKIQILGFVCHAIGRSFLYACAFSYVSQCLSKELYGRLSGTMQLGAGVGLTTQVLILLFVQKVLDDNFVPIRVLYLVLAIGTFSWCLYLRQLKKKHVFGGYKQSFAPPSPTCAPPRSSEQPRELREISTSTPTPPSTATADAADLHPVPHVHETPLPALSSDGDLTSPPHSTKPLIGDELITVVHAQPAATTTTTTPTTTTATTAAAPTFSPTSAPLSTTPLPPPSPSASPPSPSPPSPPEPAGPPPCNSSSSTTDSFPALLPLLPDSSASSSVPVSN